MCRSSTANNMNGHPSIPRPRIVVPQVVSSQSKKPEFDSIEMGAAGCRPGSDVYSEVDKHRNGACAKETHENLYAPSAAAVVYTQVNKKKETKVSPANQYETNAPVIYSEVNKERHNGTTQSPKNISQVSSPVIDSLINPSYGAYSDIEEMDSQIKSNQLKTSADFGDTYSDIEDVRTAAPASLMTSLKTNAMKPKQLLNDTYDEVNQDRTKAGDALLQSQGRDISDDEVVDINSDMMEVGLSVPEELYDTCSLLEKKRMADMDDQYSGGYDSIL